MPGSDLPEYTLHRSSRRRTIEIQVRPDQVRVLAPNRVARHRIDQLVRDKAGWIRHKLLELRTRAAEIDLPESRTLRDGSGIPYLGKEIFLDVYDNQQASKAVLSGGYLSLHLSRRIRKPQAEAINDLIESWYRSEAERYISARTAFLAAQTGLQPSSVRVRAYRRKWGCCSSRGEVRFNWLLIMAPPEVVDYVIIHELCHLQEMNHSPRFWKLVEQFCPEWKKHRKWLNSCTSLVRWPLCQ